ncbi:hypothetical protein CORC01_02153, partial [Colletotrichum orchidophilum]
SDLDRSQSYHTLQILVHAVRRAVNLVALLSTSAEQGGTRVQNSNTRPSWKPSDPTDC